MGRNRAKVQIKPTPSLRRHFSTTTSGHRWTNLDGDPAAKSLLVPELFDGQVVEEGDSLAGVRFRINGWADTGSGWADAGSGLLKYSGKGSNPGNGNDWVKEEWELFTAMFTIIYLCFKSYTPCIRGIGKIFVFKSGFYIVHILLSYSKLFGLSWVGI